MDNSKLKQTELSYKYGNGEAKVNLYTGRLLFKHQDMSIGAKYNVNVSLVYNSHLEMPTNISTFIGKNWKLSAQQYIYKSNDIYYLIDSNGMTHEFLLYDTISNKKLYFANTGISLTLQETNGNTNDVLLYDSVNNKMYFEGGKLIKYEDYNSYKVILYNYDALGRLVSIFDNRYSALKIELVYKNNLLHKIQSKKGNKVYSELTYFYNDNNQIIRVEKMNKDINKFYSLFEYDGDLLETLVSCKDKSSLIFEYSSNKVVKAYEGTRDIVLTSEYERKNTNYFGDDLYIGDDSYLGEKELKTTYHISHTSSRFGINTSSINIIKYETNYTKVTNHLGVSMIYYLDNDGYVVSTFEVANNNEKTLKTLFSEKGFLLSSQGSDADGYEINGIRAQPLNSNNIMSSDQISSEKLKDLLKYVNVKNRKVKNWQISFFIYLINDYTKNFVLCQVNNSIFTKNINRKAIGVWQYVTIDIDLIEEMNSILIYFENPNNESLNYKVANLRISPRETQKLYLEYQYNGLNDPLDSLYYLKLEYNNIVTNLNLYNYNNGEYIYITEKDFYISMLNKYKMNDQEYFYFSLCNNTKLVKADSFILEKPKDSIYNGSGMSYKDSQINYYFLIKGPSNGRENRIYNIFETLNNNVVIRKVTKCYIDGVENPEKIQELSKLTGQVIYSIDEYNVETNYFYDNNNELIKMEIGHADLEEKFIYTYSSTKDSKIKTDYLGIESEYFDEISGNLSYVSYNGYNDTNSYINLFEYNENDNIIKKTDNLTTKNNSFYKYNSKNNILASSNLKWNTQNFYEYNYRYDDLGRKTKIFVSYLENNKINKKLVEEIVYNELYDENNSLIGHKKTIKTFTSEDDYDIITYEYDNYNRLVKIYENDDIVNCGSFSNVSCGKIKSKIEDLYDPFSKLHYYYTYNENEQLVACEIKRNKKTIFSYDFSDTINTIEYNFDLHPDYDNFDKFEESFSYENNNLISPRVSSHELISTNNRGSVDPGISVKLKKEYDKLGRVKKEKYLNSVINCVKTEHIINYLTLNSSDGTKLATNIKEQEDYYEYNNYENAVFDMRLSYDYDSKFNLTTNMCEINHLKSSNQPSYTYLYSYDKSGKVLSEELIKNNNQQNKYTYNYNEEGLINTITNYSYDSQSSSIKSFSYKNGRVNTITDGSKTISIQYNNCGDCTSINNGGVVSNFEWTRGHLLNKYTKNNLEVNYNYNAFGQRVSKKIGDYNFDYYYNGDKLKIQFRYVEENSSLNQTFVFLYDNDEIVGLYHVERNKSYQFIKDCQGNVVSIVYDGEEVAHYVYDYFGNCKVYNGAGNLITDEESIGILNPIRWKSLYYDNETNLYSLGTQYYSPELITYININNIEYLNPVDYNELDLLDYCLDDKILYGIYYGGMSKWYDWLIGGSLVVCAIILTVATSGLSDLLALALGGKFLASVGSGIVAGAVGGAVSGMMINAGIQLISKGKENFSWSEFGKSAWTGAIAGAIAGGIFSTVKYFCSTESIAESFSGLSKAKENLDNVWKPICNVKKLADMPFGGDNIVRTVGNVAANYNSAYSAYILAKGTNTIVNVGMTVAYFLIENFTSDLIGLAF